MMVVCARSFRVGCLSMLPNLFPVIVLGGLLGGLWEQTDSDLLLVPAMVQLGLMRYPRRR